MRPAAYQRTVSAGDVLDNATRQAQYDLPPRAATPSANGLLAPPEAVGNGKESVALRTLRSVRSLARLGGWTSTAKDDNAAATEVGGKKSKSKKETKKAKDKAIKEGREQDKLRPSKSSGSSFEAGHLSMSFAESPQKTRKMATLGVPQEKLNKKRSILGMGLPSSIRLPTVRGGSNASSVNGSAAVHPPQTSTNTNSKKDNRLSAESSKTKRSSSTASSLRPASVLSSISGAASSRLSSSSSGAGSRLSSGSGTGSVRWDEKGLETVKERRKAERALNGQGSSAITDKTTRRHSGESSTSRHTEEGRRRKRVSELFTIPTSSTSELPKRDSGGYPILTLEEATSDGHGSDGHSTMSTPSRNRRRPMSEQMLGRARPVAMHEHGGQG